MKPITSDESSILLIDANRHGKRLSFKEDGTALLVVVVKTGRDGNTAWFLLTYDKSCIPILDKKQLSEIEARRMCKILDS
jgi:hypothetical protein